MCMCRLSKISIMTNVHKNIFLLRKISRYGIPKSTVLVIILRVFIPLLSLRNMGSISIIQLRCFEVVSQKIQDQFKKATINIGTPLSSSNSEMASNVKKNRCATIAKNQYALLLY